MVDVRFDDYELLTNVAELHAHLLHFGPIAPFGVRFIRTIAYELPLRQGLMSLACALDGDRIAGFVAFTESAAQFHETTIRKNRLHIALALLRALIAKPARMARIGRAIRMTSNRPPVSTSSVDSMAEMIALAVDLDYQGTAAIRRLGYRVSTELVRYAQRRLRERQFSQLRGIVDAFNKRTLFMYSQLGASITKIDQAGEPMYEVVFDLSRLSQDSEPP